MIEKPNASSGTIPIVPVLVEFQKFLKYRLCPDSEDGSKDRRLFSQGFSVNNHVNNKLHFKFSIFNQDRNKHDWFVGTAYCILTYFTKQQNKRTKLQVIRTLFHFLSLIYRKQRGFEKFSKKSNIYYIKKLKNDKNNDIDIFKMSFSFLFDKNCTICDTT
jgi:hypothetical protein